MNDSKEIPDVSMSNTKKEMLEAYKIVKSKLQAKEKELLNTKKTLKEMEKKIAVTTAESELVQDPLKRLHDLRGVFSRELADLAERFEKEITTFRKIQEAVKTKQEELNTLYEIETSASDLAALIEAQRIKREQFEQEMREARDKWEKEKEKREREVKEQEELIKKQWQRQKEEFEYAFAREKEQRKNALEDELKNIEKQIEQKREDFERELQEKKADLAAREEAIIKQEQEIKTLREEVKKFPATLNARVKEAVESTTERLKNDFQKTEALLRAKFEGEKNVLLSKIEYLERLVKDQASQIEELSRKHEKAYEKVQDIANRAVAASKREIVAVPFAQHPTSAQGEIKNQK